MDLYQFNKDMYKNVPFISDLHKVWKQIKKYLQEHPSRYYLMLNNENRYYTLYTFKEEYQFTRMASEILNITHELGEFYDVTVNNDGALEFWIMYEGEPTMFVLFDYSRGVVEI